MRGMTGVQATAVAALLLAGTALGGASSARADVPVVVATIKPLHALAAGVMAGVGTPDLLVQGAASPHDYALKPSDARLLDRAGVVIWAGPGVESFMPRIIDGLAGKARTLAMIDAPGVKPLPIREGGVWEPHEHAHGDHDDHDHEGHGHEEHGHDDHGHEDHDHDHGAMDGHVWLSPANARAMVAEIAHVLAEADPEHAARYRDNAAAYDARLAKLDQTVTAELAPVKTRPFIVFHDAYQYFETAYGLAGVGSVTLNPEQPPGARRITELRQRITDGGVACVFAEPQFDPRLVKTLIEGTSARNAVLDPVGADLAPGPDAYPELITALARSMTDCLAPGA